MPWGDELLRDIASRLQRTVRETDFVARWAGDEFVVLLEGVTSDAPEPLAHKLIEVIEEPLSAGGVTLQVSTSIGVALFVHDAAETPQELLKRADEAMYNAKRAGKARIALARPADTSAPPLTNPRTSMIRCLLTTPEGDVREGDIRLMDEWMRMPTAHLWVDMKGESEAQEREILERFECHPMAIQDAHKERHPPKIEEFDNHTLIIYRGISSFDAQLNFVPQQICFFVGERFLVTLHPGEAMSIERLLNEHGKNAIGPVTRAGGTESDVHLGGLFISIACWNSKRSSVISRTSC